MSERNKATTDRWSSGFTVVINYDSARLTTKSSARSVEDVLSEYDDDAEVQTALTEANKWLAKEYLANERSLRSLRLRAGLSQKQLADAIGSQQTYISRIETGQDDVRLSTIVKLAKALNTDRLTIIEVLEARNGNAAD